MRSLERKENLDIYKAVEILHILQSGLALVTSQFFSDILRIRLDKLDNFKSIRDRNPVFDMGTSIIVTVLDCLGFKLRIF